MSSYWQRKILCSFIVGIVTEIAPERRFGVLIQESRSERQGLRIRAGFGRDMITGLEVSSDLPTPSTWRTGSLRNEGATSGTGLGIEGSG